MSDKIVLILDTINPQYVALKNVIRDTWSSTLRSFGYKTYFYRGSLSTQEAYIQDGDTLILPCDDTLQHTAEKLICAMKFIKQLHPNFLLMYRTNLSSFIASHAFDNFVNTERLESIPWLYSGVIGRYKTNRIRFPFRGRLISIPIPLLFSPPIVFASGSGFFLGRDCFDLILDNINSFNANLIDDVAVGQLLNNFKIYPTFCPRNDSFDGYSSVDPSLNPEVNSFHYRVKSNSRLSDAVVMRYLHSLHHTTE